MNKGHCFKCHCMKNNWNLGEGLLALPLNLWPIVKKNTRMMSNISIPNKKFQLTFFSLSFFSAPPLSGKRIRTSSITAGRITSTVSARPSAPRKLTSILKTKRYQWSPSPEICRVYRREPAAEEKWSTIKVSMKTLGGRASTECRKIGGALFC